MATQPQDESPTRVYDAHGVTKVYPTSSGPLLALDDVSLEVGEGELVCLLGPSGCGKSTLLNVMAGLLDVTEGDINFRGNPITGASRDIGMMFQKPVLFPWRTIFENVMLSVEVLGLPKKEYAQRARDVLDLVGLQQFADAYPHELSGGMQQRAALSRVLVYEPGVLLLDEPFGALDEFTREAMNLELLRLWEANKYTIVLVTHNISEAVFLSTRVVVMTPRPGRVVRIIDVDLPQPGHARSCGRANTPICASRSENCSGSTIEFRAGLPTRSTGERSSARLPPLVVFVVAVGAWEGARARAASPRCCIHRPAEVAAAFGNSLTEPSFYADYWLTIRQILGGFILGKP